MDYACQRKKYFSPAHTHIGFHNFWNAELMNLAGSSHHVAFNCNSVRGSPGQSDLSICFMSESSPLGCSFPISARSVHNGTMAGPVHSSCLASREGPLSCYCPESAKRLSGCKTEVWRLCAVQLQQQESALNFLAKNIHQHQHLGGKAYKRINLVCYWFALLECRYTPRLP